VSLSLDVFRFGDPSVMAVCFANLLSCAAFEEFGDCGYLTEYLYCRVSSICNHRLPRPIWSSCDDVASDTTQYDFAGNAGFDC
jgi:hypothetical protein